ncbi:hypothetical protein HK102_013638, partial [Quaeritorhiza haematococci]
MDVCPEIRPPPYQRRAHPFVEAVARRFKDLAGARSHVEFSRALRDLSRDCVSPVQFAIVAERDLVSVLRRFLTVPPGGPDDELLLAQILDLLTILFSHSDTIYAHMRQCVTASVKSVLVPILDETLQLCGDSAVRQRHHRHYGDDPGTAKVNMGIGGGSHHPYQSEICSSILKFLRVVFNRTPEQDLVDIASDMRCMSTLRDFAHLLFAFPEHTGKGGGVDRVNVLASLLPFVRISKIVDLVEHETIAGVIELYVQLLVMFQEDHSPTSANKPSTCENRNVYRLVATSLRNLSCSAVAALSRSNSAAQQPEYLFHSGIHRRPSVSEWIWGDHWLFNNDIGWLLGLLNDHEQIVSKSGWGILGNLVLIKDSYAHLCVRIPQFLDMAFTCILDLQYRGTGIRKEATLMVNNFLISFCNDNSIVGGEEGWNLGSLSSLVGHPPSVVRYEIDGTSKSEGGHTDTENHRGTEAAVGGMAGDPRYRNNRDATNTPSKEKYNPVIELMKIFERCGFFHNLPDILKADGSTSNNTGTGNNAVDSTTTVTPATTLIYRAAVVELLLNLSIIAPDYVRARIAQLDNSVWSVLLPYLDDTFYPHHHLRLRQPNISSGTASPTSGSNRSPYEAFKEEQFYQVHQSTMDEMRCNLLRFVQMLVHDGEESREVDRTPFPSRQTKGDEEKEGGREKVPMSARLLRRYLLTEVGFVDFWKRLVVELVEFRRVTSDCAVKRQTVSSTNNRKIDTVLRKTRSGGKVLRKVKSESEIDAYTDGTPRRPYWLNPTAAVELELVRLLVQLFADLVWDWFTVDPAGLHSLFVRQRILLPPPSMGTTPSTASSTGTTSVTTEIGIAVFSAIKTLLTREEGMSPAHHRSGCVLIAKLLSLHYGQQVDLGMDTYLELPVDSSSSSSLSSASVGGSAPFDTTGAGTQILSYSAYFTERLLSSVLVLLDDEGYDVSGDLAEIESMRIGLQCLLGQCEAAKEYALESNLFATLVSRFKSTAVGPMQKADGGIFVIVSLARHLLANFAKAKVVASEHRLQELMCDIIFTSSSHSRENTPPPHLLLETLLCARNFAVNSPTNKKLLVEYQRPTFNLKAKDSVSPFLDALMRILSSKKLCSAGKGPGSGSAGAGYANGG